MGEANKSIYARNVTLDLFKLISAYMVVFIHYKFSGETGTILTSVARCAVPLFFVCSGYFSYNNSLVKIKNKALRLARMLVIAVAVYSAYNIIIAMIHNGIDGVSDYFAQFLNIKTIVKLIFFNCTISSIHLWFLPALIYSYLVHYFVVKFKVSDKILLACAIFALALNLILGEGLMIFGVDLGGYLFRNFLLVGYPFFVIGLLLRKNESCFIKWSVLPLILMIVLGSCEAVVSGLVFGDNDMYLGTVFAVLGIVIIAIKYPCIKCNKLMFTLVECSTSIYLWHVLVGKILSEFLLVLGIDTTSAFVENMLAVSVAVLSTVVALVLLKIQIVLRNKREKV